MVLSIQPIILFIAELAFLNINRSFKKNFKYAKHDNNKLDNIKFLELNAGPEYKF